MRVRGKSPGGDRHDREAHGLDQPFRLLDLVGEQQIQQLIVGIGQAGAEVIGEPAQAHQRIEAVHRVLHRYAVVQREYAGRVGDEAQSIALEIDVLALLGAYGNILQVGVAA